MHAQHIPSLKANFVYKSILTVSNYLIAFITFPYISRILGVEKVGLVNYIDNTINYFLLFATMGINILGVREIAKTGSNPDNRDKVFSNVLGINTLFTTITLISYCTIISAIPQFSENSALLYSGCAKILFTNFLIEWFYTGIENFRYITIRSVLIKTIYVISIFLLIKESDDYKLYFYLTIAVTVINALINFAYSQKHVKIILREFFSLRLLKDNIRLGIYNIMTSMYLTFNVMYLGTISNNIQVGYYTTAFKLYSVILGFFTAFTNVMLPRMSALASEGNNEKFNYLINKSVEFIGLVSIPLIVCCCIMAPEIIGLLCGPGYEGAIIPMRIIMPAILAVGLAQILAIQILMPLKKDKVLLRASIAGAMMSIAINIIIVPELQSIGSALVLLLSELAVTIFYMAYAKKNKLASIHFSSFFYPALKTVPCAIICLICQRLESDVVSLSLAGTSCTIIYLILNTRQINSFIHK